MFSGCFIQGKVVDSKGVGVAGVTVTLSGNANLTTTTDINGEYQLGDVINNPLPAGNYTVTPSYPDIPGVSFTPSMRNFTITIQPLEGYGDVPWPVENVDFQVNGGIVLKDYLPLREGSTWNYLQTYSDGSKDYEISCVGGTEVINGTVTNKYWEFDSGELQDYEYAYNCMAWTAEGLKQYKSVASSGESATYSPPGIWVPYMMRIGDTFTHTTTRTEYNSSGQVVGTAPSTMTITLTAEEDVTGRLGTFTNCLKFSGVETDEGETSSFIVWLAPGIGEVISIADGEIRDLISLTDQGNTYVPGN
jgi:hypothetical protein